LKLVTLLSMVVVLMLPPLISWNTYLIEVNFMGGKPLNYFAFLFHFIVFVAIFIVIMMLLKYFKVAFRKNLVMLKIFRIFFYLVIGVILLFELNHLLFYQAIVIGNVKDFSFGKYSLITSLIGALYATFVLARGFASRSGYLRIFALLAIVAIMVKILLYDSKFMDDNTRYLSYFSIGFLILVGWIVYPRLVNRKKGHRHRSKGRNRSKHGLRTHREPSK
jgi:hypothetical protein